MRVRSIGLVMLMSAAASAAPIMFDGSSGSHAAEAIFDASGGSLVVTLSNTSASDMLVPTDVLTSVFFDITGNPTLGRVSGVLAPGSDIEHGTAPADGVIGGTWTFKGGLSGAPGDAMYGLSTAGFGLFGPHDVFPGSSYGSTGAGGDAYGIASLGDNPLTGNSPTISDPFIHSSAVFTLSGLPAGFDLSSIANVRFQYGTDLATANTSFGPTPSPTPLSPPGLTAVSIPEPATVSLFLGAAMLGLAKRRRVAQRTA
jgi:hypothetical protein